MPHALPACRVRIDQFPVGSKLMNELMTAVRVEANKVQALLIGTKLPSFSNSCMTLLAVSSHLSSAPQAGDVLSQG